MRRFLDSWDGYETKALGFEADDDRAIVHVHHRGAGQASGARSEMSYFAVWTFQEDRVVRVDLAQDRDVAIQSARSASVHSGS